MKGTAMRKVVIKQDPENVIETEVLEQAIVDVSQAAKKLQSSRLTNRAIQVLIRDSSGSRIGLDVIRDVLELAAGLEERYLKKER